MRLWLPPHPWARSSSEEPDIAAPGTVPAHTHTPPHVGVHWVSSDLKPTDPVSRWHTYGGSTGIIGHATPRRQVFEAEAANLSKPPSLYIGGDIPTRMSSKGMWVHIIFPTLGRKTPFALELCSCEGRVGCVQPSKK